MSDRSSIMGTYVLALWLGAPRRLVVGRLGEFLFPVGWYLYVGSAHGPGGLPARLGRHRRRIGAGKRARWHVDHLREEGTWGGAWSRRSGERLECKWARQLHDLPGAEIVVPGFGASDCHCAAHLVWLRDLPEESWFEKTLDAERTAVEKRELEDLIEILVMAGDEEREVAAHALARFGSPAAERLASLLAVDNSDTRWWATRALAEVGGREAVTALTDVLDDTDPDLRACAALALGRIRDGSSASVLTGLLADESPFVASIAADALSMIGEAAVDTLTESLSAESPHTRLLAVRALSRIRSQRAIGPLFGVLEDPSYLVRYYAQEALEALGVGMVLFAP